MLSLIVQVLLIQTCLSAALCLLVKYLLVCIATNTPEDGRVVDETWLLAVAAGCGCSPCSTQLKHSALGPIKRCKACLFSQLHTSP